MKRKVSLIGPSTLMVSLPSKWVEQNKIKKGDELDIELLEQELIISSKPKQPDYKKIDLDEKSLGFITKNILAYLYHKGYDEIRINFNHENDKRFVLSKINELIGYEIVSETQDTITIKNVSEPKPEEFDNILRRTFLLLLEMAKGCYDSLAALDTDKLGEVALLESANNRYTDYCKRTINKFGYKERANSSLIYIIIRDLEKIADIYKSICMYFLKNGADKLDKILLDTLKNTNYLLKLFYELYYKFDVKKAEEFKLIYDKTYKITFENLITLKSKMDNSSRIIFCTYLLQLQNTIYELYGPFYTLKI